MKGARQEEEESSKGGADQCNSFVAKWQKDVKCSSHVKHTQLTAKRGRVAMHRQMSFVL